MGIEALTESMFFEIEQRPKLERWGTPSESMRRFGWNVSQGMMAGSTQRTVLWIPPDDFVVVQIAETASDPNQLRSTERTIG